MKLVCIYIFNFDKMSLQIVFLLLLQHIFVNFVDHIFGYTEASFTENKANKEYPEQDKQRQ